MEGQKRVHKESMADPSYAMVSHGSLIERHGWSMDDPRLPMAGPWRVLGGSVEGMVHNGGRHGGSMTGPWKAIEGAIEGPLRVYGGSMKDP